MSDPTSPSIPTPSIEEIAARANGLILSLEEKKAEYEQLVGNFANQSAQREAAWNDEIQKANDAREIEKKTIEEINRLASEARSSAEAAKADNKKISEARARFEKLQTETDRSLAQANEKQQNLDSKLLEIEESITSLSERKKALEADATEIEAAHTSIEKAKETAGTTLIAISEAQKKTETLVNGAQDSLSILQTQEGQISKSIEALQVEIESLGEKKEALKNALDEVQKNKEEIETNKNSALSDVQSITETRGKFDALKTEAQTAHDELIMRRGETLEKISEIDSTYERIKAERAELLEDKTVDGAVVRSIGNSIRDANAEFYKFIAEAKDSAQNDKSARDALAATSEKNWTDLKEGFIAEGDGLIRTSKGEIDALKASLQGEIRQLLPGAGAAGLSWAYYDAKTMYGPGKFEFSGNRADKNYTLKKAGAWILHVAQYRSARAMFYLMFIGPLLLVAYYFYELMNFMLQHPQNFNINLILFRALISLPLATVSLFGWSSIRLYRRLYEEYNHKQRVMQLYESFKKELEKAGTDEQRRALLTIMLATVGDKPTLAMHSYDKAFEIQWPTLTQLLGVGTTPSKDSTPASS